MKTEQKGQQTNTRRTNTRKMVLVAMLGAVSTVLMLLEFNVPLVPPFIKMDFSELPIILGGFIMGPLAGSAIVLIKILLNLVFNGTTTMFVGEAMNLLLSLCYMLPSVLIYRCKKTKKWAAISMALGTVIVSIAGVLMNYFVMFPLYAWAYKMPMDSIISMGSAVNPAVDSLFTMMLFSILPFNLFKYGLVSLITFLVYKKIAGFIRNIIMN